MEESQGFKPDLGNPAVRDYRGASENVTLVEMCSHLATERAGMGTLHLTVGASELYPNQQHAKDVAEQVREGEMPPWFYLPMHPGARLTSAEKQALVEGVEKSLGPQSGPEKH